MPAISTAAYKKVIDDLKVVTNSRYTPVGDKTFCNYFAHDVMNGYGYKLPVNGTGDCATIFDGLYGNVDPHWKSVSFSDAQARANSGIPTVAITSGKAKKSPDTTMDDHIAVIYPSGKTPTVVKDVSISQAGRSLLQNSTIAWGWPAAAHSSIRFYSYY